MFWYLIKNSDIYYSLFVNKNIKLLYHLWLIKHIIPYQKIALKNISRKTSHTLHIHLNKYSTINDWKFAAIDFSFLKEVNLQITVKLTCAKYLI